MPKSPRRSRDPVQAAHQVYLEIIGEAPRQVPPIPDDSPAAVAKRKGGAQGGTRRAAKLTPGERPGVARKAARARWKTSRVVRGDSVPGPDGLRGDGDKPIVTYACLCEKALQEKDNVISLIRIVDTFYIEKLPTVEELPPGIPAGIQFTIAIGLKPGRARGPHELGLTLVRPSGERDEFKESWPIVFDDEYHGANFLFQFVLLPKELGTYGLDVSFDRDTLTSTVFRLLAPEKKNGS